MTHQRLDPHSSTLHQAGYMRATAAVLVRSARTHRWWQRGHQPGVAEAVTSSLNSDRGRGAAASISSSTSVGSGDDVTKKFGDPSFWESQYSSQVCLSRSGANTWWRRANMHPVLRWFGSIRLNFLRTASSGSVCFPTSPEIAQFRWFQFRHSNCCCGF